jgi:ATP-binding cassette subfamily B protein
VNAPNLSDAEAAAAPRLPLTRRIGLLVGNRRRSVVALAACSIVAGFAESATLATIAQVAASLVKGTHHLDAHIGPVHVNTPLSTLIDIALALTLLRLVLQLPLATLPARIAATVQTQMRTELFDAYAHASWDVQSEDREGQLQETMTGQIMQAAVGAQQATMLLNSALTFLIFLATAVLLNLLAAVIVAAMTIVMFALLRPLRRRVQRSSRELSAAQVQYAGGVAETIRVAEEAHVFGVIRAQKERMAHLIKAYNDLVYQTGVRSRLVSKLYESLIVVLLVLGVAALYVIGAHRIGSLGGVILLLLRASTSGQAVQSAFQGLTQSLPFIERTQETLRRYAESAPTDGGHALPHIERLAFESVSFAYRKDRPVLSEVGFAVEAGETIGIVGPSGAGKSTLVQLLLQLRTPQVGRYLVNGDSVEEYSRADWNRLVSYVPQEPRLLHATVDENIRFLREIDRSEVERAARLARIHNDVIAWADGYDTLVGPRADAVSGGQKQRICLARALAARPEMLVLDEPTSALDPHSEAQIGESLTALKDELTLFIIAHRMSTLDICDRIIVLVDGRLVAFDTRVALQRNNTYYRIASEIANGTQPSAAR